MKDLFTLIFVFPVLFIAGLLTGCMGGGGGFTIWDGDLGDIDYNGSSSHPFIKWSDVTAPDAVDFDGLSSDGSYTAPAPGFSVTSITDNGFSIGSKATIVYDGGGSITSIAIQTPVTTVIWKESDGDLIDDSGAIIGVRNVVGSKAALVSNALDPSVGWEYQTYGVWATGLGQGAGTYGAISVGVPTAGSSIPLIGDATFTGSTVGGYVDPAGTYFLTSGSVSVDADFVNRSLDFSSASTQTINPSSFATSPAPNLNMTGTLTYAPGTNSFGGGVTTVGGLTGTSTGQFYGPNAEELGGVFFLTGDGVEMYDGSYGAKR
jgi:hypothetical protein